MKTLCAFLLSAWAVSGQQFYADSAHQPPPAIVAVQTNVTTATSVTAVFPRAMPNSNYSVTVSTTGFALASLNVTERTTTSCTVSFGIGSGTVMITCVEQR